MAKLLNIDTAIENALVCLSINGVVIDELVNTNLKDHASFLQVAIKTLCEKNKILLKDIDAVAVTAGPGSYTGLRVGLASAKGICYALQKPLILLNTLKVMAQSAVTSSTLFSIHNNALICPMIDARRMEVFTAIYNSNLDEIMPPCALILHEHSFSEILEKNEVLFIGNGVKKINLLNKNFNILVDEITISAASISYLSHKYYVNQQFTNLAYSEPFYIKPFQDTTSK